MTIKKQPLTEKQKDVLEAFQEFTKTHDYSPTMRELKEVLKTNRAWKDKSISSIQACLRGMRAKGYIKTMSKSKKSRKLQLA